MSDHLIRPAQIEDFKFVATLDNEGHRLHESLEPRLFTDGSNMTREELEERLSGGNHGCLVAEVDGRIAGFLAYAVITPQRWPGLACRKLLRINKLAVHETDRKRGIGRLLCQEAERIARDAACDLVELNAWTRNRTACEFYESLDYRSASKRYVKELSLEHNCGKTKPSKNFGVAVKAAVFKGQRVLVLHKSKAKAVKSIAPQAHIDLPGGRVDFGEDPTRALMREIAEETGLTATVLAPFNSWTHVRDNFQLVGIDYLCEWTGGNVTLSDEHESFEWLSLEQLRETGWQLTSTLEAAFSLHDSAKPMQHEISRTCNHTRFRSGAPTAARTP
ncbi:MAG: bifunctional GNAT family N-acetyltransferase/NUDIX hydrolase [Gordonibacter sp.]|nr:bifunctional GNAT family N-acetyltransferase/NUDIX hydrolase [Gordonibacter sp.]